MAVSSTLSLRSKIVSLAALAALAFAVVPAGSALASPAAGVGHAAVVSSSPSAVAVPKVVGKTAYSAKKSLAKVGLSYTYIAPAGSFVLLSKNWTVVKQSPKAASTAVKGTKVKLTVVKTATLKSGSSAPTPSAPAGPALSVAQQQAVLAAQGYVRMGGFSHQGLIDQLSSPYGNGFSVADATFAVDSMQIDYNAQAVIAAKSYLSMGGFSRASLVEQLSSPYGNKFTPAEAEYAATQVGL